MCLVDGNFLFETIWGLPRVPALGCMHTAPEAIPDHRRWSIANLAPMKNALEMVWNIEKHAKSNKGKQGTLALLNERTLRGWAATGREVAIAGGKNRLFPFQKCLRYYSVRSVGQKAAFQCSLLSHCRPYGV